MGACTRACMRACLHLPVAPWAPRLARRCGHVEEVEVLEEEVEVVEVEAAGGQSKRRTGVGEGGAERVGGAEQTWHRLDTS